MDSTKPESFRSIPSATGGITRLVCAKLREHDKDIASIMIRAGLPPEVIDDPSERVEAGGQVKLLELAAQELGGDLLGFHLAQGFNVREIGLVYYVMASSEVLADALRDGERYSQIVNEGVRLHVGLGEGASVSLE